MYGLFDLETGALVCQQDTKPALHRWLRDNEQPNACAIKELSNKIPKDTAISETTALIATARSGARIPWSEDELRIVHTHYTYSAATIQEKFLTDRPLHQIKHRLDDFLAMLKLDTELARYEFEHELKHKYKKVTARPYSKKEDELIIKYWFLGNRNISNVLRGRTPKSIGNRKIILEAKGLH